MSAVPVKENFFQLTLTAILRLDVVFGEAWVLLVGLLSRDREVDFCCCFDRE